MDDREADTCIIILRYVSANPDKSQNEMMREAGLADRTFVGKCLGAMRRQNLVKKEKAEYHSQKVHHILLKPGKVLLRDIDHIEGCVKGFNSFVSEMDSVFSGLLVNDKMPASRKRAILQSRGFPKEHVKTWKESYDACFRVGSYSAEIGLNLIITQFMASFTGFAKIPLARKMLLFVFVNELLKMLVPKYIDKEPLDRIGANIMAIGRQEALSGTYVSELLSEFQKSKILQNPALGPSAYSMLTAIDELTVYGDNKLGGKLARLEQWMTESNSPEEKKMISDLIERTKRNQNSS